MREKFSHQDHLLQSFFWFRRVSGLVHSGYNRRVPKQMAQILSGSLACNSILGSEFPSQLKNGNTKLLARNENFFLSHL